MRRFVCAVPIALLVAISGLGQTRITAVRFWSLGDVTRVAIETDGETRYRAERIDNPERLFFDLPDTRPLGRGLETIPVGDRLLKQIRIARTSPDVTRVVLDLAVPFEYSVSHLTNPDRIMVELRVPGKGPATPPIRSVTGNHPIPEPGLAEAEQEPGPRPAPVAAAETPKPARPVLRMPLPRVAESRPVPEPPSLRISEHKPLPEPLRAAAPQIAESRPAPDPLRPATPRVAESKPLPEIPRARTEPKNAAETALAAKRDSHGDRSMIRALGLKLGRVVLDPGHGGQDAGTIGLGGLEEKTLVLDVAQRLGALITQRLGSEVVYTRSDDSFVPLEARTGLANEKRADLFLSIHANSSRLRGISGSEAYYLNFTTSASALEVAARENASSQKSIHELQSLLQKIVLKEKTQESREFAAAVQASLHASLWRGRAVKNRGVKQAPFVVLIGAQMPSVLAEIAFLSNPKDEAQLKRTEYRQRVAEALFKGVAQYANTLSHFQVARGKSAEAQP
ncbi:MAG: N-acetylmuramoyl-L-alanine amidase [Bryobacteraceae bacterium]|jgi:N-acetylmuramoyl-L-alanine amidase